MIIINIGTTKDPNPKEYFKNLDIYNPMEPVLKSNKLMIEIIPAAKRKIPNTSERSLGFTTLSILFSELFVVLRLDNMYHLILFYLFL
jgi:hypothetical protein